MFLWYIHLCTSVDGCAGVLLRCWLRFTVRRLLAASSQKFGGRARGRKDATVSIKELIRTGSRNTYNSLHSTIRIWYTVTFIQIYTGAFAENIRMHPRPKALRVASQNRTVVHPRIVRRLPANRNRARQFRESEDHEICFPPNETSNFDFLSVH
jgi:hypothetical protein